VCCYCLALPLLIKQQQRTQLHILSVGEHFSAALLGTTLTAAEARNHDGFLLTEHTKLIRRAVHWGGGVLNVKRFLHLVDEIHGSAVAIERVCVCVNLVCVSV
jgi:hypothetical protein